MASDSERQDAGELCAEIASHSPPGVRWSERETQLLEAWECKKQLMLLQEELSTLSERAQPELLGRSASDCGMPDMRDAHDCLEDLPRLARSASSVDCSKPASKRSSWAPRTRSLSDHDFQELRGCIDLGFHFHHTSCSEFWGTLPALEVCCAVAQNFPDPPCSMSLDSSASESLPAQSFRPSPTPSWRIASPGDDDEGIKERLRHWAQAVACNARLCY